MAQKPRTLGELEKVVYESRWEDGLLDILGAIGVLAVGGSWEANLAWAGPLVVPVLLVAWSFLRNSVVESRAGHVVFSRARRDKERQGTQLSAMLGVGLLLLIMGAVFVGTRAAGAPAEWLRVWIAALPAGLLALMALIVAGMLGLRRFVLYAVVLLASGVIGTRLGLEPGTQILIAGGVIFLAGLVLFIRFLSDHSMIGDLGGTE